MTYTKSREPDNTDAVAALGITGFSWNRPFTDYSQLSVPSGQTKPTESAIATKLAQLKTEWTNSDYQRKRQAEYPSLGDQLDDIYHNGIDAWKATIKTTKDKYPKP